MKRADEIFKMLKDLDNLTAKTAHPLSDYDIPDEIRDAIVSYETAVLRVHFAVAMDISHRMMEIAKARENWDAKARKLVEALQGK